MLVSTMRDVKILTGEYQELTLTDLLSSSSPTISPSIPSQLALVIEYQWLESLSLRFIPPSVRLEDSTWPRAPQE